MAAYVLTEGGRLVGVQSGEGTQFSQALFCEVPGVKEVYGLTDQSEAAFLTC